MCDFSVAYNLFMDGVVREVYERVLGRGACLLDERGARWKVCQLLFADDTALVADSEERLQRLVDEFARVCDRRKLRVNVNKGKVMRCAREEGRRMEVRLGGERLEEVECFKYLGSTVG